MADYPDGFAQLRESRVAVSVFADRSELMRAAADRVASIAERCIAERGRFDWALSGGKTPEDLYRLLSNPAYASRVDWARVHFYWSDERCVPPDHPDSNYRLARESLLDRVQPSEAQVHRLQGEVPPVLESKRYEGVLAANVVSAPGTASTPRFDLILLGMGPDGHTASLFPGAKALKEADRWVVATCIEGRDVARLTFTPTLINAAAHVLFLVAGADKAGALASVLGEPPHEPLPAGWIRPEAGELEWLVDHDAAILL
jgi:6-phosphogluconolactonase